MVILRGPHLVSSLLLRALLPWLLASAPVSAASYTTETFSAGAGGWQGSSELGTGSWTYTGGVAKLTFSDTGFVAIPDVGSLSNNGTASGGAFTGNYVAAGIEVMGFRFLSNTDMPSSVRLHLVGPTSEYRRIFYPSQTGVWVTLAASLASAEAGGWDRIGGPNTDFLNVLQDVRRVSIKVDRAGSTVRQYFMDEIFLGRRPAASAMAMGTQGLVAVQVDSLQSNVTYRVEAAPDVTGTWSSVYTFDAAPPSTWVELTNTADRQFWRVTLP